MICLLLFSLFTTTAFAWVANEVDFPGDGQGWDLATTNSYKFTGPDGSAEWFRFEWTASAADSDYNFKMVTGNNWTQDYGGNLIFPKNELAILYYQPLGDSASKLSGGVISGKRYLFTVKDPGLANTFISVMELSSAPVSITTVSRNATTGLITINLTGAPSAEEKVYVRFTDSNWTYSQVIQAQVTGSTATTTIPDLKDGKTYQWYAMTSTATPDKFHNSYATDALTISYRKDVSGNFTITGVPRISNLTINSASGPYQTTKFFIDEIAADSLSLNVSTTFNAGTAPSEVQVLTNLNRRDKADQDNNGDGVADGILPPPRDLATTGETHYYKAYAMTNSSGSTWTTTLPVTITGAYRATVRYRFGTGTWFYYGDRDHAVVVSPKKTLEMILYEINTLTIEATANNQAGRSTFVDLLSAADGDTDGYDHMNLDYFNTIQTNCLWFQPIHPTGGLGVENDPATSAPYVPGSPYATKNFFAVNPAFGSANTESSAMSEFQNFVAKADAYTGSVGTINVMLDFVANHTAWDAIYGQVGVDLGLTGSATTAIPVNWYSRTSDYGQPATYFTSLTDKDKAVAPDRNDFGKWADVADLYFGRYSAQWRYDSYPTEASRPHKNEDDFVDFNSLSPEVIKLWRYIGQYPMYWLQQTGHSLSNSTTGTYAQRLTADDKGIDSLRCDFGQGLPNPLWEYIINKTRSVKWNFVFMAETLDGAEPGYRSNRVFDILNESIVFQFTGNPPVNKEWALQSALESRRSGYRTGAILLNLTGHDEIMPDNDTWLNATRYGALSTVPGLPMIFNGQEQGIQRFNQTANNWHFDGFETDHELNFGKRVPHFKKWNRAQFWTNPPPKNGGLAQWYGRVNWARLNSPAIKSINQYYLDQKIGGGTPADNIFAIAKYEQASASPAFKDVVLCFANLFEHNATAPGTGITTHFDTSETFDIRGGVGDPLWNLLGLQNSAARQYNVRNLASSNATANLWPSARTGSDIYSNGIFVRLNGGVGPAEITADGALVQYLKIVDVTPPPASAPRTSYFQIGNQGTFTWTSNAGPHDNIIGYRISIGTTPGGNNLVSNASVTGTDYVFTGNPGQTYYATLTAVSGAGVSSSAGSSDTGSPNPNSQTTAVMLLSPTDDQDNDGTNNQDEAAAGTNPLDRTSRFAITDVTRSGNNISLSFPTVTGRFYHVYSSTDLVSWTLEDEPSAKNRAGTGSPISFTDLNAAGLRKFYQSQATTGIIP